MMRYRFLYGLIIVLIVFNSCQENWDEHYNTVPETVDEKLIDVLKEHSEYSVFLDYINKVGMDSVLQSNESKTLFIPRNEAFDQLSSGDTLGYLKKIMAYHISPAIFLSNNVQSTRKLLTYGGKYLYIEKIGGSIKVDSIPVDYSSPLCLDGKFYGLSSVLIPPPSIYSYMEIYSPILKGYIDQFDTLYLDLSKSIPLGYNDLGQTVYDSVFVESNLFEEQYFPISKEFRNRTATLLLFTQEQYDEAIAGMAANIGTDPSNIPLVWQNEILIPYFIKKSVFEGSLEYTDFHPELKNIQGDTSFIDPASIDPASKTLCSNGVIYNYADFTVPEELYLEKRIFEAENYLDALGLGRYVWDPEYVKFYSSIITEPTAFESDQASNDTLVSSIFEFSYTGSYWIEFTLDNVFPGDYVLEWRGNYRPSGSYKVYVNSVDVTETSPMAVSGAFDMYLFRKVIFGVIPGTVYVPDSDRNNSVDFMVKDIINEYGNVTVRIEYQDGGSQLNNGLSIDYLALTLIQN